MKKRTIGAGVLIAMMLISPITGNYAEASIQTTQQATQKVMWGKNELSQTQIGRIVFSNDVKIYKRGTDGKVSFHMNAKKGSMWRVHKITTEGNSNVYDLGGGVRVKQSNLSTYEKAPSDLISKQMKQNNNGAFLAWEENRSTVMRSLCTHRFISLQMKLQRIKSIRYFNLALLPTSNHQKHLISPILY